MRRKLYTLPDTKPLAIFPKRSTYCTLSQTKSLNSRSLPMSVVINPEECFCAVESTAVVWRRSISIVTVTILSHFLKGRTVPGAMGKKSEGKSQMVTLDPQRNLGPITAAGPRKGSWINRPGTWSENPWVLQQNCSDVGRTSAFT